MKLRYFYDEKLAHASYLVGCQATGEALIMDPGRDVEMYIEAAEQEGMRITSVTETHIHADLLSGLRELSTRTGATAYLSDEGDTDWKYQFADELGAVLLKDNDTWKVGNIIMQAMHTPGHTPEHMSFLLTDSAGADKPMGIFTGDFVFVGDVGRPDLLEEAAGFTATKEPAARTLYASLQRFADLPDYMQVWPAHGAGSACGKALGAIPSTTVGYEKMFNWAFRVENEAEFVQMVLDGQPEPPRYFAMMKKLNKVGPPLLNGSPRPARLTGHRLVDLVTAEAVVIDTRESGAFAEAHVPGTWNIPLSSSFTTYAGWLLNYDDPFYLIVDEGRLDETMHLLHSIGLDTAAGYVCPEAIHFWSRFTGQELASMQQASPQQIKDAVMDGRVQMLDVRGKTEYDEGHLPGAFNIPLGYILNRVQELHTDRPVLINCQSGVRSAIAASLLESQGFHQVINLRGGYVDWAAEGLVIERVSG